MRVVIPAALVLAFASPAYADQAAAWAGVGTTPCTAYAQAYKQGLGDLYFVWAQGFMSGVNTRHVPSHEETDLLSKAFPSQAQERFIQRYCDQHPLVDYVDAVLGLWREMRRSQGLPFEGLP